MAAHGTRGALAPGERIYAVADVHGEPGCQLYALHESDGSFIFIEQWADVAALQAHATSPATTRMFTEVGDHLAGQPQITMAQAIPAGDPAKGQLTT